MATAAGQSPADGRRPADLEDAIERARALVQERLAEGVPAFSVAVGIGGDLVWEQAFGIADVESGRAATPTTLFRIGSTSKPIAAAVAARMAQRDDFSLDRPIAELAGGLYPHQPSPSLAQLLSHQAGVRHYRGAEYVSRERYASLAAGLAIFRDDPPLFEPGAGFSYSSYGFNLAGAVLEQVSGLEFGDLAGREVFEPLAMTHTRIDDPTIWIPERAAFYVGGSDGPRPALPVDDSYKAPSGGLLSTAADLVRFGSAFLAPGFLDEAILDRVLSPLRTAAGEETGYGLGWRVRAAAETYPRLAVHHGGSSMGGRSMLVVLPEAGVVVALLCNSGSYESKEADAFAIAAWFADLAAAQPSASAARKPE